MTDDTRLRVGVPVASGRAALSRAGDVGESRRAHRGRRSASSLARLPNELARRTEARRGIDCAAEDLEILARRGGRLVTADDAEWPLLSFAAFAGVDHRLRPQAHPPLALWAVGPARLDDMAERAVAIVGTRASTAYGEHVAADLAAGLVERDVTVVSGGAYGIDGAAHRATLATDGFTVAVLAGGIDVPYPAGHAALLHRIGAAGPGRERVSARRASGAPSVPDPQPAGRRVVGCDGGRRGGRPQRGGEHRGVGAGAGAWGVCGARAGDVVGLGRMSCVAAQRRRARHPRRRCRRTASGRVGELAPDEQRPESALDGLGEAEQRVYDALPARGRRTVDQIAVASGLPPTQVLGPLSMLEVSGLVTRQDGYWKLSRRT